MCRPITLGAALLFAAALPGTGSAQETEADLAARLDELAPLVEEARLEAEAAERRRSEQERLLSESTVWVDTIFVGDLRIIAPLEDVATARRIFEEAWDGRYALVESSVVDDWTFTFQTDAPPRSIYVSDDDHVRPLHTKWWQSDADRVAAVREAIGGVVTGELSDSEIGRWASGDPFRPHDMARLYRIMATARSTAVRSCLAGEVEACVTSLGLGVGEAAIEAWYSPEERRDIVMTGLQNFRIDQRSEGPTYMACFRDADIDACDELILSQPRRWAPLPGSVRSSLLGFAIDRGGRDAWTRLLESRDAAPEETLAYVAGIDLGQLVAEWRDHVFENRPETYAGIGGKSLLSILWIVFFAALAMRSTRWRLG